MAALAIGLAGGGATFALGLGFGPGFFVGRIIGGLLFPAEPNVVTGPRRQDLRIQASTYGIAIPRLHATDRFAGNIIWSSGVRETVIETESGGKGFGAPKTVSRRFVYHVDFAIGLCKGPIAGIVKVFADSKLLYDFSDSNTGPIGTNGTPTVYLGTETQLPDPLIQADKGVANTPAFRGLAYLLVENLEVSDTGRIPNITVIASTEGTGTKPFNTIAEPITAEVLEQVQSARSYTRFTDSIAVIDHRSSTILISGLVSGTFGSGLGSGSRITADVEGRFIYVGGFPDNYDPIYKIDSRTLAVAASYGVYHAFGADDRIRANDMIAYGRAKAPVTIKDSGGAFVTVFQSLLACVGVDAEIAFIIPETMTFLKKFAGTSLFDNLTPRWAAIDSDLTTWAVAADATTLKLFPISLNGGQPFQLASIDLSSSFTSSSVTCRVAYLKSLDALVISKGDQVIRWDIATQTVTKTRVSPFHGDSNSDPWWHSGPASDGQWYMRATGDVVRILDIDAWTLEAAPPDMDDWVTDDYSAGGAYDPVIDAVIAHGSTNLRILFQAKFADGTKGLDQVVSDEVLLSELVASDIDVTGLAGEIVRGYVVSAQGKARDSLAPLAQAYFFDAVETDDKIKFVKRGGASSASIPEIDLGVHSGSSRREPILETRLMEAEIPARVNITYRNKENDYQDSTQHERRIAEAMESREVLTITLPIVFSDDEAKRVAQRTLLFAWTARARFEASIGRKWLRLDPTDIVTITVGSVAHIVRIEEVGLGADGVIELKGAAEDVSVYTSILTGMASDQPAASLRIVVSTTGFLIDSPMLRDDDDNVGFYVAAGPEREESSWRGAFLLDSSDGVNFGILDAIPNAISYGFAMTVLADAPRWTVFDRTGTVKVGWINGDENLASVTELDVLNGQNAFLVGDEIVQAATVTDNGDGTFTLSTLLRGRRGTDFAMAGHAVGDRVLLLDKNNLRRPVTEASRLNVQRFYRFDTVGSPTPNDFDEAFTNIGRGLMPYSPAYVRGIRSGADLVVTWLRRGRMAGEWRDEVDVPLGEGSEVYDAIMNKANGGTDQSHLGLTSETTTFTGAEITSAGYTDNNDPISVTIYQLNEIVSRGFARTVTV